MSTRYSSSFPVETLNGFTDHRWRDPSSFVTRQERDVSQNDKRRRRGRDDVNEAYRARMSNENRSRRVFKELLSAYNQTPSDEENEHWRYTRYHRHRHHQRKPDRHRWDSHHRQRNELYPARINLFQACQVTILYGRDSSSTKTDEIVVKQKANEHEPFFIVYKGYLKQNERFSFKSQHVVDYPFNVKFYVNGHKRVHLKECCEHKFRQDGCRLSHALFIEQVVKAIPCQRCQRRENKENQQKKGSEIKRISSYRQYSESRERNSDEDDQQVFNETLFQSTHSRSSEHDEDHQENPTGKEQTAMNKKEESEADQDTSTSSDEVEQSKENENNQLVFQVPDDGTGNGTSLFFQSFLSFLRKEAQVRESLPAREEGNVEDFIVVLLCVDDQDDQIRSMFNFVKSFDQIEPLNTFIDSLTCERILLITNPSSLQSLQDLSRFDSIYLHSADLADEETENNVRGTFDDLQDIFQAMKEENSIDNQSICIQFLSLTQAFVYSQLLKETLLRKDNEENLKKDFFGFCRMHYQGNPAELRLIDQCEQELSLTTIAEWLSKPSFLRKMINRACRTKEIDLLFKLRWILQLLDQQIRNNEVFEKVYRTDYLSTNQLEKLQECGSDEMISFGNFLICQRDEPSSSKWRANMETVLFTIEDSRGLALNGRQHSKDCVLLPFDNVYRIESIEKVDQEGDYQHYWSVKLTVVKKDDPQLVESTKEMREQMESPVILIQLGKLLLANDDYLHADYLARLLFNDGSMKDDPTQLAAIAAIHHLLGSADNRRGHHRAARLQFEQSLKIFLTFVPEDNVMLSATYNNIGSMYYQDDEHEQAIVYHQKALQCQLKSPSPDIEAIATYTGNIGAVYLDQKKYDQAVFHYKRALQILLQSTPNEESLAIAMVYDRLACIYWRMDEPENALPFYQKSLQLELKYLPENDHKISVSYFNLSTAYARLERLDEAITCAEKSVEQLLKSVPSDHPEVKENIEQLEGLRRKKWLRQLYQ